jgi:hypothetical protein
MHVDHLGDIPIAQTVRSQQNDPGPSSYPSLDRARPRPRLQHLTVTHPQWQRWKTHAHQ